MPDQIDEPAREGIMSERSVHRVMIVVERVRRRAETARPSELQIKKG